MKKISLCLAFGLLSLAGKAKDGYNIKVKINDLKDSMVYLVHYYGKSQVVYKTDSVKLNGKGEANFKGSQKLLGGIYLLLPESKNNYFEFLLNNGDDFSMNLNLKDVANTITFKGSDENTRFYEYQKYLVNYDKDQTGLKAKLDAAKTKADTQKVRDESQVLAKQLNQYRDDYMTKYPNTLLANVFGAIKEPEIPKEFPKLANGKVDSAYGYRFYKSHYWDWFKFNDDRLVNTPIYHRKLDEYFNRVLPQVPDSIIPEADKIMTKTHGSSELFKYTLTFLTYNAESSKIMGMDEVFVHMVEKYHMRGEAPWIDSALMTKIVDRAYKIAPNLVGRKGQDLELKTIADKPLKLYDVKSPYTLLIFWAPDCGHCRTELPRIDSVYRASLKDMGVKVLAVKTADGTIEEWKKFIEEKNISKDWIHAYDPDRVSNYRYYYDVIATPTIYLLDGNKVIRGKKLGDDNITGLVEFLEKKKKEGVKNN